MTDMLSDEVIDVCRELSGCSYGGAALAERFKKVREAAADFEYEQVGELAEQIFGELM